MATALCLGLAALGIHAAPANSLSQTVSFPPPTVSLTKDGRTCVNVAGCEPDMQTAKPVLPVTGLSFDIPSGFEVASVTLTPVLIREIPLAAPVQCGQPPRLPDDPPQPPVAPDAGIYGGATPYPNAAQPVWRTDPSEGTTLLSVKVFPVRFDPSRNVLLAAGAVTATVTLQPAAAPLPAARSLKRSALTSDTPCSYLIISTSNLIHQTPGPWNLQSLCDTRARAGFTPAIIDIDWIYAHYAGTNNPARIRAFIQDAHQQWGTRYVLIAGTFALIPVQKLYISIPSFMTTYTAEIPADAIYYGCLDGNFDGNGNGRYGELTDGPGGGDVDLTAEVFVGRFPAENAEELANMVRKTLRYEAATAQDLAPNAFMAEKVNMGSLIYADGYMEEIRLGTNTYSLDSLGFENSVYAQSFDTEAYRLYDSSNGLWTATDALAFLNRNLHTVNHMGHGSSTYCAKIPLNTSAYRDAVRAFTNNMPYFMYSQACSSGALDTPNCFAEQIVTVSNAAVAAVMNAREGWEYTDVVGGFSHLFHRTFWDAALRGSATRLGEINEVSRRRNLHLVSTYAATHWRWVYYELNLFGDPAMPFAPALNAVLPTIVHEPLINTYDTQTPHRVTCTLEPVGIYDPQAVTLVWQTDREPELSHTQHMAQVDGNLFEGFIDAQQAKTRIAYSIHARNHAGYESRWPAAEDTAFYVTERLNLTVYGSPLDYGAVSPDYGVTYSASGLVMTASAPEHVPESADSRYTCIGFFGTGSVPQSSTNREAAFQIDRHSMLVWQWKHEHRLTLSSTNAAFAAQSFWSPEGGTFAVPAVPQALTNGGTEYAFAEWRLDGTRSPAAPAYCGLSYGGLLVDAPHALEAVYLPAERDGDGNGIPDWWEYRYYGASGQDPQSDEDLDGYTLADEYADRTSPLDASVIPAPPVIRHTPLAENQSRPGPFAVRAAIDDTRGIASATVLWHRKTEAWQATPMSAVSNNLFEAQIGLLSAPGDDFEYRITAADLTGYTAQTDAYFFFLQYPVADTSRFHDLNVVSLPTQLALSAFMDLHNTGNADMTWSLRLARVESILATNLPAWDTASLGQPWEISTNRAASAPYALHAKLLSDSAVKLPVRSTITFPPTLLGPHAVLSFKHWIHSEIDGNTTRAFDGGIVEISTDGGTTFEQLRGPYTHTIYGWQASPWPDGTPCFAGKGTGEWQTVTFDLAALYPEMNGFSGRTVRFRFHYGGDNNTDMEGWYIDDVSVSPLLSQNGFANSIEPGYGYTVPAGNFKRILWSNFPTSLDVRNDNLTVFLESNDPVSPRFSFYWQIKIRDYPVLSGLSAAQTTTGDGLMKLTTDVYDVDGEPVSLAVQWSPDGGKSWAPAALTNLFAAFGSAPAHTATGDIANISTSQRSLPATNRLAATWASREIAPSILVNTQLVFRITADNTYYRATYATGKLTVDNEPPVFTPGTLTVSPLSAVGPYAVTANLLTLTWPAATDNPATNLTYHLLDNDAANSLACTTATLALSNSLDAVHAFRVVALDPAGNASAPLATSLPVLNARGDYDADGMTTADEEIAGTSAADATDRLAAGLSSEAGGMLLVWPSVAGRLYTVEATPSLSAPDWQPLPGCTDLIGTGYALKVQLPTTQPATFFRIRVRLP